MKALNAKKPGRVPWVPFLILIMAALVLFPADRASANDGFLVGRMSHVEGQVLRFVPDDGDWVVTVRDAPFGLDDALYTDRGSRAEFIMPNDTWVRIGGSTQVQLIALKNDLTEVDVASGVARFYNKSANGLIKASTPFGFVVAQPGSTFDLYVGDDSAEVITLGGRIDFFHGNDIRYEVTSGSHSLIADAVRVGIGEADVDEIWDDWNLERDRLWSRRLAVRGDSVKYLPPGLHHDAYVLDENGRWELVSYEGKNRYFWRPTRVGSGWAPFTAGRWTVYYGDNTWIPAEPFGYTTHHYGNWVYVKNAWYWAPPERTTVRLVWYPGRVAWIGSGTNAGWVPLAPNERYYSHYNWGPSVTVIGAATVAELAINTLAYLSHAVLVPQQHFYAVNNYSTVRITNINKTTIINSYRAAPVVNTTIIRHTPDRSRFSFTNVKVVNKPHQIVLKRIERNRELARQEAARANAQNLRQAIARARQADRPDQIRMPAPKVTHRIVPVNQANRPASELKFQARDLKERPKRVQPGPGAPGQKKVEPMKAAPNKPADQGRREDARRSVEPENSRRENVGRPVGSSGPENGPGNRAVQTGPAGQRGPGAGREPVAEQKRATPDRQTPRVEEERRPGAQQSPRMENRPQPQQLQQPRTEQQPRQLRQNQPGQQEEQSRQRIQPQGRQQQGDDDKKRGNRDNRDDQKRQNDRERRDDDREKEQGRGQR